MEPLWDRVDRNRLKLAGLVISFIIASALGFTSLFAVPWFLFKYFGTIRQAATRQQFWVSYAIGLAWVAGAIALAAAVWATFTLLRSEKWLVKRLDATLVPRGELLDTKFALKDMALAAGLRVAPALYLMRETSTNAFVFAARRRRAVIGVTEGFTTKLTVDEQRAVFANLIARLASGDAMVSTGVTALMWPVHAWRLSRMTAEAEAESAALAQDAPLGERTEDAARIYARGAADGAIVLYFFFAIGFAILAELVAGGHRRAQLSTAEKADAEGMLLLKDPCAMLSALKRCVELNNLVPAAGESFAELFYCWTGVSTNDEDDPEWLRVARLREVLGVMGHEPETPGDGSDHPVGPPRAPRLDEPEP